MDLPVTNDQKGVAVRGHCYDAAFMEYAVLSNTLSARAIIQILLNDLPIASVLDVGCATGTWLKEWKASGVADIRGIDGDYVKRDQLQISPTEFVSRDLSLSFHLGRTFDLVQSLEVAEHLAAESAARFVESLTGHSSGLVLFSAAPPGQGGEFHINERPFEYWRTLFRQRRFVPFDCIRPRIADRADISFWYRYNVLLRARGPHGHVAAGDRFDKAARWRARSGYFSFALQVTQVPAAASALFRSADARPSQVARIARLENLIRSRGHYRHRA